MGKLDIPYINKHGQWYHPPYRAYKVFEIRHYPGNEGATLVYRTMFAHRCQAMQYLKCRVNHECLPPMMMRVDVERGCKLPRHPFYKFWPQGCPYPDTEYLFKEER